MTDTFDVDVTRDLDGPVEAAWAAWSTPEGLRAWWGPGPFTCPAAEVDLRVGGRALIAMRAPAEYGAGAHEESCEGDEDRQDFNDPDQALGHDPPRL